MILRENIYGKLFFGDAVNAAIDRFKRKGFVVTHDRPFDKKEIKAFTHGNPRFGDDGFISQFHELERIINVIVLNPENYGITLEKRHEQTSYVG